MRNRPRATLSSVSFAAHALFVLAILYHVLIVISQYRANGFFLHDVGQESYWLYHTWHGRFFWSIVHECPHFAKHFTPTYALLVPLQMLFPHVLLLPILQCLAVLSGAWAVAWMTDGFLRRGRKGRGFSMLGLATGWFYVGNPFVGSMVLSNHFESFPMALSLWALAALANRRKRLFWILMVLAVGFKEDMALYWALFGAWWVCCGWERPRRKPHTAGKSGEVRSALAHRFPFGLAVGFFGIVALVLAVLTIRWTSAAAGISLSDFESRYGWLGETAPDWPRTALRYPEILWFPLRNVLLILMPPVLFLPLAAPFTLLLSVLPAYLMGLAQYGPMYEFLYYYSYPFLPFLYLGVAQGTARLARAVGPFRGRRVMRTALAILLAAAGCWMITLPTRTDQKRRVPEKVTERHAWIRGTLREVVPREASVAAQFDLLCQLPFRRDMLPLTLHNTERAEYWALDRGGAIGDLPRADFEAIQNKARAMAARGTAEILVGQHGLLIVRRRDAEKRPAP